jgi:GNAT superfamily N-acetyltransferase
MDLRSPAPSRLKDIPPTQSPRLKKILFETKSNTSNMPFKLEEVDTTLDFPELIACEWESYEDPYQPFFRLFCPIHGDGVDARAESLKECTARQLSWHESDPTSFWQKVVDTESGKIVGGALWKICLENPFEHPDEHSEVYWYPEDSTREFVGQALEQFDAPRARLARRPQVCMLLSGPRYLQPNCIDSGSDLNIIFTHPNYRRQGVGEIMLEWGIKKAKELGVEMWLDATPYGRPLYEKFGFKVANENRLQPRTDTPDEKWEKIEKELLPITFWQMWLPKDGADDKSEMPEHWENANIIDPVPS